MEWPTDQATSVVVEGRDSRLVSPVAVAAEEQREAHHTSCSPGAVAAVTTRGAPPPTPLLGVSTSDLDATRRVSYSSCPPPLPLPADSAAITSSTAPVAVDPRTIAGCNDDNIHDRWPHQDAPSCQQVNGSSTQQQRQRKTSRGAAVSFPDARELLSRALSDGTVREEDRPEQDQRHEQHHHHVDGDEDSTGHHTPRNELQDASSSTPRSDSGSSQQRRRKASREAALSFPDPSELLSRALSGGTGKEEERPEQDQRQADGYDGSGQHQHQHESSAQEGRNGNTRQRQRRKSSRGAAISFPNVSELLLSPALSDGGGAVVDERQDRPPAEEQERERQEQRQDGKVPVGDRFSLDVSISGASSMGWSEAFDADDTSGSVSILSISSAPWLLLYQVHLCTAV